MGRRAVSCAGGSGLRPGLGTVGGRGGGCSKAPLTRDCRPDGGVPAGDAKPDASAAAALCPTTAVAAAEVEGCSEVAAESSANPRMSSC